MYHGKYTVASIDPNMPRHVRISGVDGIRQVRAFADENRAQAWASESIEALDEMMEGLDRNWKPRQWWGPTRVWHRSTQHATVVVRRKARVYTVEIKPIHAAESSYTCAAPPFDHIEDVLTRLGTLYTAHIQRVETLCRIEPPPKST